jgi:hypothetical protein
MNSRCPRYCRRMPQNRIGEMGSLCRAGRTRIRKWRQQGCGLHVGLGEVCDRSRAVAGGQGEPCAEPGDDATDADAGNGRLGLGLHIGGSEGMRYFSHDGTNEGFRNVFVAYEKSGEGAVVMTNSDNGSDLRMR